MLAPAIKYEERVNELYKDKVLYNNKYMFWNAAQCWNYELLGGEKDDWDNMCFVSLSYPKNSKFILLDSKPIINGLFTARLRRNDDYVGSLGMLSFDDKLNWVFAKDLIKFIDKLWDMGMRKINFNCVVGNPILSSYYKIMNSKDNIEYIGTDHASVKLIDGTYYDLALFEIWNPNISMKRLYNK